MTRGVLKRNTHGSALVRMGDTQILAGTTLLVGQPRGDKDAGDVTVSYSHSYTSNTTKRPTAANSSTTAAWISNLLQNTLDRTRLSIVPGKAAWRIHITLQILNDAGNVTDASLLAALTALQDTTLPPTQLNTDGIVEIVGTDDDANDGDQMMEEASNNMKSNNNANNSNGQRLELKRLPIPLTMGLYSSSSTTAGEATCAVHLLADPTRQEEPILSGKITIVVALDPSAEADPANVVYMRHAAKVPIGREELEMAVRMAEGRAEHVSKTMATL